MIKKKAYWDILLRQNISSWTVTILLIHPSESLEPSSRVKRKSLRFGKQLQWAVIRLCHFSGSVDVLYPLLHKGLWVRITRKSVPACIQQNASGCRRTSWYFWQLYTGSYYIFWHFKLKDSLSLVPFTLHQIIAFWVFSCSHRKRDLYHRSIPVCEGVKSPVTEPERKPWCSGES